jgi:amino acid transporter
MNTKPQKSLGFFTLAMMSVAAIVNLRSIPLMASVGYQAIFFYLLAALTFLLPSALVCASLAKSCPQAGGIYTWVKQAFGEAAGFFAIWSEWFNNVISFPATASFIASALLYMVYPELAQNKFVVFGLLVSILWLCSFYNCLGIVASSRLNILGAVLGTLLPAVIIIGLALLWIVHGLPRQIHFSPGQVFPPFQISSFVFLTGVFSSYAGMQVTAFHAPNVRNPERNFPLAIIIATILIIAITLFSALAIAYVVPNQEITLTAGVMQGFHYFFQAFHLPWASNVLGMLIILSGISSLAAWLLAPARGLAVAATQNDFPKFFAKENRRSVPVRLLMLQAFLATLLAITFVFLPTISQAFWLLIVLTSQFTLVMYVLLFAAGIRLMPKSLGKFAKLSFWGKRLFCVLGMLVSFLAYLLGFFPPEQLHFQHLWQFEGLILLGNAIYIALPIIIYRRNRVSRGAIQTV